MIQIRMQRNQNTERTARYSKTELIFPGVGDADHDPLLTDIKHTWELCSKPVHGSIFGIANFIGNAPKNTGGPSIAFFDLPTDSLQSMFFYVVTEHLTILKLFTPVMESYMGDPAPWRLEYK